MTAFYKDEIAVLKKTISKLETRINQLVEFFSICGNCPCCNQYRECEDGCTFAHDDPAAYEAMTEARKVLYPE